jgi:lysophospholipase L1-like esterase
MKPLLFAALWCLVARADAAETSRRFDFGPDTAAAGYMWVSPQFSYARERGFGFESIEGLAGHSARDKATAEDDFITAERPILFSVTVPEGNYRVRVSWVGAGEEAALTVKAESRRLVLESLTAPAGTVQKAEFVVNVRNASLPPPPPNAPGGIEVRLNDREVGHYNWDEKLTLEFNGPNPKIAALEIEPVDVPTIFLAGDSTVTDQRWEPGASWGQMLPRFFQPRIAVANHAESGETLKSFLTGLRLDKILSQLRAGDYVFLQFGHNDSKQQWPQTYVEADTTYLAYLRAYVVEVKRRGATPVLVTSMHRRSFDQNGKIKDTHGRYPEAVRRLAREESVTLIDLHAMSAQLYEALGPEKSPLAFSADGKDATHHNNYGAYQLAKCVVEGIRASQLPLQEFLLPLPVYSPAQPDPVENFRVPASPARSNLAPRGN